MGEEKPEPPILIGEPPKATPELLRRGKGLYTKAKCFQCHGESGKGDGPAAVPSFNDAMTDDERWAISYYVLSLSAFNDPLTGTKLEVDAATRAQLNDPDERAFSSPRLALDPTASTSSSS